MVRMACRYVTVLTARDEFLEGIGPCRVEQPEKQPPVAGPGHDERLVDETFQRPLDLGAVNPALLRNRKRSFQRKVPNEDRDTSQDNSFGWGQVIVAPIQRRFERLMPRRCRPATELQKVEARAQLRHSIPDAEDSRSPGSELDSKRNAVKLAADLGNHRGFVVAKRKTAATSTDTLGEQPCSRIGKHFGRSQPRPLRRTIQWRKTEHMFARDL